MKKSIPFVLAGVALLSGLFVPRVFAQDEDEARLSLERRVTALEGELAKEVQAHEDTRALLDATLVYLDKQNRAAEWLLGELDRSEELGFTAGINYESREVLLGGWRTYWSERLQGFPATVVQETAEDAQK